MARELGPFIPSDIYSSLKAVNYRLTFFLATVSSDCQPSVAPVSFVHLQSPSTVLLALARRRHSFLHILARPQAMLSVATSGNICLGCQGSISVARESMISLQDFALLKFDISRVKDDATDHARVDSGISFSWIDEEAATVESRVMEELRSYVN
jgi:hypothetical protein